MQTFQNYVPGCSQLYCDFLLCSDRKKNIPCFQNSKCLLNLHSCALIGTIVVFFSSTTGVSYRGEQMGMQRVGTVPQNSCSILQALQDFSQGTIGIHSGIICRTGPPYTGLVNHCLDHSTFDSSQQGTSFYI